MNAAACIVVVAGGLFLVGLAGLAFLKPLLAKQFFMSFASSARTHYGEQALRLLMGASLAVLSASMWHPTLFRILGWAIVITSGALLLIPWQLHHRFGKLILPRIVQHLKLYAFGVLAFGALLLYGVFGSNA